MGAAIQIFVITWMPGPRWLEGASIYEQLFIGGHADHVDQLLTDNRIVLSGPFAPPGHRPPRSA